MGDIFQVTSKMFFDRAAVVKAVGRKNTTVLARTGGFARTTMKQGMRKRKKVSAADGLSYPSSHSGELRNLIFFAYDAARKGVVVGPLAFGSKVGGKTVPQLINEGGSMTKAVTYRDSGRTSSRRFVYKPRPFVALALATTLPIFRENMAKIPLK
jgi:hypothetical protein